MNPIVWLDETFALRVVQTMMHFVWQGAAIALLVYVLAEGLKRWSAQTRYVIQVVALLAMAACPIFTFVCLEGPNAETTQLGPSFAVVMSSGGSTGTAPWNTTLASSERPAETSTFELTRTAKDERGEMRRPAPDAGPSFESEFAVQGLGPAQTVFRATDRNRLGETSRPPSRIAIAAPYVAVMYFVCVLCMLLRLFAAVRGGQALRISASRVDDGEVVARMKRQAQRLGIRVQPALGYCERISVPIVVGLMRPMILLPSALVSGLSPDQLEALMTHELAHLKRYDPLVNLLQRLVEAILFFHPAVWYLSRRIHFERENASDDLVLASGHRRVDYADALVRMAELSARLREGQTAHLPALLAASGGSSSEFKRRVMRLLDGEPAPFRLTRSGLITLATLLLLLACTPLIVDLWAQSPVDPPREEDRNVEAEREPAGRVIREFRLRDYLGTEHALSDLSESEVVVVVFLGTECPLARLYGSRLADLARTYASKGATFVGINSNQQDTPTEIGHYVRRHKIDFVLLKDPGNRIADQFGAVRTPEAFVLDKQRTVRYWGRIDDQFGVGFARPSPTKFFLRDAVDDLLMGRPVRDGRSESVGCYIGRVTRGAPTGEITYTNQVSRIVQQRCVECHREDGVGPFALESYEAVAAWAETIREVVDEGRMPPWHADPRFGHFANDSRMPDAEKELLAQWVANGVPRGEPDQLPPPAEFVEGWMLGRPDLVLTMPEPMTVPATGVVDYQYVEIDPGFKEGKWVRASEIRPGVRSVVHHIVVFIDPPGGDPILEERGVGFETVGGYVPGSPPMELADDVARYVPPGSTFVFQLHYTPDGTRRSDQSQIGLYFADPKTVRRTMQTGVVVNLEFEIPPHAGHHRVEAAHRVSHDFALHTLVPHMHYRGKAFRFEATYPNGSREILLDVPRYDFNWQNSYRLSEPKLLPEGTLLKCVAYYDNSSDNPSNPDPTTAVRWGEQTWEEMMVGYFEGVYLNQDLSRPEPRLTRQDQGTYRAHFEYRPDRPVKTVVVAGTFNEWNNMSDELTDPDGDGVYTIDTVVAAGEHRYKFVVDGHYWTHDPASRILTGYLHESFFVAGGNDLERGD